MGSFLVTLREATAGVGGSLNPFCRNARLDP